MYWYSTMDGCGQHKRSEGGSVNSYKPIKFCFPIVNDVDFCSLWPQYPQISTIP